MISQILDIFALPSLRAVPSCRLQHPGSKGTGRLLHVPTEWRREWCLKPSTRSLVPFPPSPVRYVECNLPIHQGRAEADSTEQTTPSSTRGYYFSTNYCFYPIFIWFLSIIFIPTTTTLLYKGANPNIISFSPPSLFPLSPSWKPPFSADHCHIKCRI